MIMVPAFGSPINIRCNRRLVLLCCASSEAEPHFNAPLISQLFPADAHYYTLNMRLLYTLLVLILSAAAAHAQEPARYTMPVQADSPNTADGDDLMAVLESSAPSSTPKPDYVQATFKSTRVVNGHSVETMGQGVMDFRITHRFGNVNTGLGELFGLDQAFVRIGFDYGVKDWLLVGVGRSSFLKEYDGFAKVKLLRQRTGGGMPITLTYAGGASIRTDQIVRADGRKTFFSSRLAYFNQLLAARKFGDRLSIQLMPTHVHYNLVPEREDPNDLIALGIGGRLKLSNRITFNAEWYYRFNGENYEGTYNPLSVGFDIETGGHVFQLHFTNSTGTTERAFVGQTAGNFWDGDIRFGFNISRVFTVVKPRDMRGMRNSIY